MGDARRVGASASPKNVRRELGAGGRRAGTREQRGQEVYWRPEERGRGARFPKAKGFKEKQEKITPYCVIFAI